MVHLDVPWNKDSKETWLEAIKRACKSDINSNIRRTIPLSPENVLALIKDASAHPAHLPNNHWNFERTSDGIRICEGNHHRSADCEWTEYIPKVGQ